MTPVRTRWLAAWHGARLARKLDLDDLPDERRQHLLIWATDRLGALGRTRINVAAHLALQARETGPAMPTIRFIQARSWAETRMRRVPRIERRAA